MAQIKVTVRNDAGDLGMHPKFGALVPGATLTIEEEDFGSGLFNRPEGFLSPHEKKDQERAAELKQRVGEQDPPPVVEEDPAPGEEAPAAKGKEKGGK